MIIEEKNADLGYMKAVKDKDLNSWYLYYQTHTVVKESELEKEMFNAFFG